jgi:hypothetical protein
MGLGWDVCVKDTFFPTFMLSFSNLSHAGLLSQSLFLYTPLKTTLFKNIHRILIAS